MAESVSRRVFFALWPDAAARDSLDELAALCSSQCGGRRVVRDNLHLTLAFIGLVSPEQIEGLQGAASRVQAAPFEMVFDRLGCWSRNRILWAGCSEPPAPEGQLFSSLARELSRAGFFLEARPHVPHVTLVRDAHCDSLKKREIAIPWRADTLSLVESSLLTTGARYHVVAQWPLGQG